ncbi:NAD(P)H-hydrate dehydratase [Agarivorans gilvus]|uniref:Bifunctional NAD(P)H-hydrate repair enzyme n=1 Tax=Agarivorans gilvus TaxID=680279 RepID=A0ABQ1I8L3_9ALTE|nr:NAD(P)H-hydrate dehydratase [Agarivorans gilvus]GGB19353.1 bifunctional NAD(P)H-hydrate repair enzyme [Agarivorans gilvus]
MAQTQELFSSSLPQTLWCAEQVKTQEALLAKQQGISLSQLMERAGQAAFAYMQSRWPKARQILVLAGGGNNGGDAYVLARLAKLSGKQIQLLELGQVEGLPEEAHLAREAWLAAGGRAENLERINWQCDVVVDGVLGTGLASPLREPLMELFSRVNQTKAEVLALDIPSGLCADSGRNWGQVIQATATITFIALKQGLFTGQAAEYVGELVLADLGVGEAFEQQNQSSVKRLPRHLLDPMLAPRSRLAHKGHCGRALLVGGNQGMAGAIRMAAEACLRSGAGLVNVLTHGDSIGTVSYGRPELMVSAAALRQDQFLQQATCCVIGPGLGQDDWAKQLFIWALDAAVPCLVDADGLNLLAKQSLHRVDWILTPHPGEAARLLACSVAEVEVDRVSAARQIQARYGGVCVLKGAGTVIAGEEQQLSICCAGNPGMASGGMGDVLSGIIGGLLAQLAERYSLFEIACLAVNIHGQAADLAAKQGERGMLASDLMPFIRQRVNP